MKRKVFHLVWILCGATACGGCSDPRATAATQARLDRMNETIAMLRDRENEDPRRLAVMSDRIAQEGRSRDEALVHNLRWFSEIARQDVRRWHDRQPEYRSGIKDALDGDLKRAHDTIPRMFY